MGQLCRCCGNHAVERQNWMRWECTSCTTTYPDWAYTTNLSDTEACRAIVQVGKWAKSRRERRDTSGAYDNALAMLADACNNIKRFH